MLYSNVARHMTTQGVYLSVKSLIISSIITKYYLHNKHMLNMFSNTPPSS